MKKYTMTKKEIAVHNLTRVALALAFVATPFTSFAYTQNLNDLVVLSVKYFNQAVYVIIAIAVVVFVWNIYHYFFKADVENKKEAGLYVMYSVIGFFVIVSFWGLVNIVSGTFNLNTSAPSLNFFGSSFSGSGSNNSGFNQGTGGATNNTGFNQGTGGATNNTGFDQGTAAPAGTNNIQALPDQTFDSSGSV